MSGKYHIEPSQADTRADHAIELSITFEGGAGVTSAVSPAEVRFTTSRLLDPGQRISGTIQFSPEADAVVTVVRYVARVIDAWSPPGFQGVLSIRALFERLEFAAQGAAGPGTSAPLPVQPP